MDEQTRIEGETEKNQLDTHAANRSAAEAQQTAAREDSHDSSGDENGARTEAVESHALDPADALDPAEPSGVDQDGGVQLPDAADQTSQPFVGRWNRLVSTTNWEKGRVICDWRQELIGQGESAMLYSDEAWARRVGGITGQHVGRLRRVFQRFGDVYDQYANLYWSHFQAALEWDDAEMWLEGAVQSNWSVSQMRRVRWDTLGADPRREPGDEDIVSNEVDEDFEPALKEAPQETPQETPKERSREGAAREETQGPRHEGPDFGEQGESDTREPLTAQAPDPAAAGASIYTADDAETISFVRPFENLADLPQDLSEAFDSFKLAILRHKADGWQMVPRDDVLASLDALKELALAPSAEESRY